jgi:hypothetical protein
MKRVPDELKRLRAEILSNGSGLFLEFINSVRHYMVGFIAIPNTRSEFPWPCGCATLVTANGAYYFLTAAHVWKELQKFKLVGVTLVENLDQRFAIETQHLIATGPPKPTKEQDGPDIVLLKIPNVKLGEIKARKSFYPLEPVVKKLGVSVASIEIPILLGAPGEAAALLKPDTLDMVIQAIIPISTPRKFTKGRYDYLDLKGFFGAHAYPTSYGGFSGGPLWHVHVYLDPTTGERKERRHLAGMAFYEFPQKRKYRVIRCHGSKSVKTVMRML